MTGVGHLHVLPRRSIAVRFTPVSGIDSRSQALPGRAKPRTRAPQQTASIRSPCHAIVLPSRRYMCRLNEIFPMTYQWGIVELEGGRLHLAGWWWDLY
jgi:hypothetical protein